MEEVSISHLQFADDTLFFLENFRIVDTILKFFSVCSGLKINMGKSTIVGINVDSSLLQEIAMSLGCEAGEWPQVS